MVAEERQTVVYYVVYRIGTGHVLVRRWKLTTRFIIHLLMADARDFSRMAAWKGMSDTSAENAGITFETVRQLRHVEEAVCFFIDGDFLCTIIFIFALPLTILTSIHS